MTCSGKALTETLFKTIYNALMIKVLIVCCYSISYLCVRVSLQHTQQFADKRLYFEGFKIIGVFSSPNENDWTPGGSHAVKRQK